MKILICAHTFYPDANGVSIVASEIAKRLAAKGHHISVATGRSSRIAGGDLDGVRIRRFECDGSLVNGLGGEISEYRRFVESDDSDIVVLHCAQTWSTDALLDWVRSAARPVILVSHGLSAYGLASYGTYFSKLAESFRRHPPIISLSPRLEEGGFCAEFRLAPPCIIRNGVDLDEWRQPSKDMRVQLGVGDSPWILSVSNHSTVKNHQLFWWLASEVRKRIPSARAAIIGRSYSAAKFSLGRLGVKGGCWYSCCFRRLMSNRVELLSHLPRYEVVSAVKQCDVVAITSTREAAPLVQLESMAAGVPWVCFRVGSVEDNKGGIIVDGRLEFARAVEKILGDKEFARSLGAQGREQIERERDWSVIAQEHQAVYEAALGSSRC